MSGSLVVGVDLGGTNMQVGVVRGGGGAGGGGRVGPGGVGEGWEIIGRAKKKTKAEKGAAAVLDRVAEGIVKAVAEAGVGMGEIRAVGLGVPGAVDAGRGVVTEAPNLRWRDVDVVAEMRGRLECEGLGGEAVMVLENDVNAAVWGEHLAGAGRGAGDVLGVWVGTGVGGGLVLNGRLHHGASGSAGEIGHTLLFPNAPLTFRKLEDVCSRTAVIRRVIHLVEANERSIVSELAAEKGRAVVDIGSGTVASAYERGDEVVRDVVDESADYLGRGIANAVTLLGTGRVVLGGGLTEAMGSAFVDRVERSCREHVFPATAAGGLEVRVTELEDDAGLLGAALLAMACVGAGETVGAEGAGGGA